MAHAWKACWVQALGGSNPPFSADFSLCLARFSGLLRPAKAPPGGCLSEADRDHWPSPPFSTADPRSLNFSQELFPGPRSCRAIGREVRTGSLRFGGSPRYTHRNYEPFATNRSQIILQQIFHRIHPRSPNVVHHTRGFPQGQLGEPLGNVSNVHWLIPKAGERWDERQLESQFDNRDEETVELRGAQRCERDARAADRKLRLPLLFEIAKGGMIDRANDWRGVRTDDRHVQQVLCDTGSLQRGDQVLGLGRIPLG